jgi:hypothetical protein
MDQSSNKTDDADGYKSPGASLVVIDPPPKTPFNRRTIPMDDNHTCPVCNGKGFIQIVNEKNVPRKLKRDVLGKLFPYEESK